MAEIIPAILPKSLEDLDAKVRELPEEIYMVHFDVLPEDIWTSLGKEFEAHLMVDPPAGGLGVEVDKWVERGAKRIIVHERVEKPEGVELGLGVEMRVPLEEAFQNMDGFDFVHLMSIDEIGEQGHPFDEKIFDRIKQVKEKFPSLPISIDGGVNVENYLELEALGVDRLIVGSGFKELWQTLQTRE